MSKGSNQPVILKISHPQGFPPSTDHFAILCALLMFKIVNKTCLQKKKKTKRNIVNKNVCISLSEDLQL